MQTIQTDILIIGSGATGLSAAVYAGQSEQKVLVLDKGAVGKSGSTVGAVQIASLGPWSHPDDSEESYKKDIEESGRGLSDPKLTETLANNLPQRLNDLVDWGLKFDTDKDKNPIVTPTSGHSIPRSVSARKGQTGLAILQTLTRKVKKLKNVDKWSDVITLELVKNDEKVTGAIVFDLREAKPYIIQSKAVILATGGIGQLYPTTSNPVQSTGDGYSLALGAGATLTNMEQVQFYPVSLVAPQSISGFCISFYHYSKLYNSNGKRFMQDYEPDTLENTTRDKLSIAIASEVKDGRGTPHGGVWLDVSEKLNNVKKEFPHEYELSTERGIDLVNGRAEVGPAAHFMMGGVKIDQATATNVPGLFVAGETSGGLHGGNRLGNNALSECVVFGAEAGMETAKLAKESTLTSIAQDHLNTPFADMYLEKIQAGSNGHISPYDLKSKIQSIMGKHASVIRSSQGLSQADKELRHYRDQLNQVKITENKSYSREILDFIEVGHMLQTAQAIVGSALQRQESRGAHYRQDYPELATETYHTFVHSENGNFKFSSAKE